MYRIVPRFPAPGHAPRKIHKFVYGSSFQSIDLAVITVPSKPLYTTRVQASVRDKAATDKISEQTKCNFIRSHISFFAILGCYTAKSEPKNDSNSPINDYIGPHSRKSA